MITKKRIGFLALLIVFAAGCGSSDAGRVSVQNGTFYAAGNASAAAGAENGQTQQEEAEDLAEDMSGQPDGEGDAAENEDADICLILANDPVNSQITLLDMTNGMQVCYEYTEGTEFFFLFLNYTPSQSFSIGSLAVIKRLNSNDTLGALAFTDRTWDYDGIINYEIDTVQNKISIAGKPYRYDASLHVFSDGKETTLASIGKGDELTMYGVGKDIYSIVVESGHGTLALTNTKLFEGGWLNLGTKMYVVITPDMKIDVPEGVYDFSVANDGYGDKGEIRIRRDKVTTIDLNDYKGEGPKMCKVTFHVDVEDAVLAVDGKEIDYSKPQELRYGVYQLTVIAEGYDVWSKQLVIKSPTASIEIGIGNASKGDGGKSTLDENSSAQGASDDNNTSPSEPLAGSLAGSRAGRSSASSGGSSQNNTSRNNTSSLSDAALNSSLANIITGGDSTDYLDTLSDLVDSLEKLESRKNKSKNNDEE